MIATGLWLLTRGGTIFAIVRQTIVAVQALGNYLKLPDAVKKETAVRTIDVLLRDRLPLPAFVEPHLPKIIDTLLEWVLKLVKREHGVAWKTTRTSTLPLPTTKQAAELVKQGEPLDPILEPKPDYLAIAVSEFEAIERKNAAKRAALKGS